MRKPTIGELIREQLGVISSFNQQIYKATLAMQRAINKLNDLSTSKECQKEIED